MHKTCINPWCQQPFEVTDTDLAFYEKVSPVFNGRKELIPPPTRCPECRLQRRMTWRNQIHVYFRTSDSTGKSFFSMFDQSSPVCPIADSDWWSDGWDPLQYGLSIDADRSVLSQIQLLSTTVPVFARSVKNTENSDYSNNGYYLKNCYVVFHSFSAEDCMYCEKAHHARDCVECTYIINSELCYDCTWCHGCYNLQSSQFSQNCSDSFYLHRCVGCRDCFGCVNLQKKQYCYFNEQKTKSEYESLVSQFQMESFRARMQMQNQFQNFILKFPVPNIIAVQTDDVSGNCLQECRDVHSSFFITRGEAHRYCFSLAGSKDCYDVTTYGDGCELLYECTVCGENSQRLLFCYECFDGSSDLLYCQYCIGCSDCFGCISLQRKKFCIFNQQYTKDEYCRIVPQLIEKMRLNGEWGENFPAIMSPIAYNHSLAQRYFPLSQQDVERRGLRWHEESSRDVSQSIDPSQLPDKLPETNDTVIVRSSESHRPFKITSQEIQKYRQLRVPLPRRTYDERMEERIAILGGVKIFSRSCAKCQKPISTSYSPERPEIVYCEECYLKEVY